MDIVAARMPDRIMPAMTAKNTPCRLIRSERRMMIVSASALPVRNGSFPAADTLYPITPMDTAMNMEITTHTVARRRDWFSSFSLRIAMKRSRICGIPK